jgi:capsular exopolysaccharide synthesis family protein
VETKRYTKLLRRWVWLIVLLPVLGMLGATGISATTTRVYSASTKLLIDQSPNSSASLDYNSLLSSQLIAKTYSEMLNVRPVLEKVIAKLNLKTDPETLAKHVSTSVIRDTQLIELSVQDTDPVRAANTANELVAEFSRQNRDIQESRYSATSQTVQQELTIVQADIDRTQASIDPLKNVTDPAKVAERDRLEALLAGYHNSYATLLKSLEEVRLAESQTANNLVVVESAQPDPRAVQPKTTLNIVLGFVLGLFLALAFVLVKDYFDESVKSTSEVEHIIDAPSLGTIPQFTRSSDFHSLVINPEVPTQITEAYRVLRANIEAAGGGSSPRTIIMCSAAPGEGKTTTLANLAVVFAQSGKRVIAVSTDLRKPALHKFFDLRNPTLPESLRWSERGVTVALKEQRGRVEDHLVPTSVNNLWLMPSGPLPPNPAELLGSRRMAELIDEVKSLADVVIFDSPPARAFADATLLARACDAAIIVVKAESTQAMSLKKTRKQLANAGTKLLGFVFNSDSTSSEDYPEYDYYSQVPRVRMQWAIARRWTSLQAWLASRSARIKVKTPQDFPNRTQGGK